MRTQVTVLIAAVVGAVLIPTAPAAPVPVAYTVQDQNGGFGGGGSGSAGDDTGGGGDFLTNLWQFFSGGSTGGSGSTQVTAPTGPSAGSDAPDDRPFERFLYWFGGPGPAA